MEINFLFGGFLKRVADGLSPVDQTAVPTAERGVTQAAVTLLLRPVVGEADAEILFIKRAQRAGDPWSGHLAFPGGRAEARDATLLEVALRETAEEVAIDVRQGGTVVGRLPTLRPLSVRIPSIAVTPFVALAPPGVVPRPQPGEVEAVFWMPLATIRRNGRSDTVRWETSEGTRELSAYPSSHGPIWGLTERILSQFLALVEQR